MSSNAKPVIQQDGNQYLISDGSNKGIILPQWLESRYWQERDSLQKTALGRGSSWFVENGEEQYVLRHYQRGGMVAQLLSDQYLWLGLKSTRVWQEWQVLNYLQEQELPAPAPVAARVIRHGLFYTADILITRILNTRSLSELLLKQPLEQKDWTELGRIIRRFHHNHVYHADLNAHNILLDDTHRIYLIDFDKARIKQGSHWQLQNLKRLKRSLLKLTGLNQGFNFDEAVWESLMAGYHS